MAHSRSPCPKSLDPEVFSRQHVKLGVSSAGLIGLVGMMHIGPKLLCIVAHNRVCRPGLCL